MMTTQIRKLETDVSDQASRIDSVCGQLKQAQAECESERLAKENMHDIYTKVSSIS